MLAAACAACSSSSKPDGDPGDPGGGPQPGDPTDAAVARARALAAEVVLEPHVNPAPQHR